MPKRKPPTRPLPNPRTAQQPPGQGPRQNDYEPTQPTCVSGASASRQQAREGQMSTEHQREQAERQRVFAQDQSVRQASTFHQHALADAQTPRGRFSAVETATVIGSKPDAASAYPAASAAHQIQLPDEPPLSLDNPALNPSELEAVSSAPQATNGPGDPSAPLGVERAGPSFSSEPMTAQRMSQ